MHSVLLKPLWETLLLYGNEDQPWHIRMLARNPKLGNLVESIEIHEGEWQESFDTVLETCSPRSVRVFTRPNPHMFRSLLLLNTTRLQSLTIKHISWDMSPQKISIPLDELSSSQLETYASLESVELIHFYDEPNDTQDFIDAGLSLFRFPTKLSIRGDGPIRLVGQQRLLRESLRVLHVSSTVGFPVTREFFDDIAQLHIRTLELELGGNEGVIKLPVQELTARLPDPGYLAALRRLILRLRVHRCRLDPEAVSRLESVCEQRGIRAEIAQLRPPW